MQQRANLVDLENMLLNEPFNAKIGFDTAENGPKFGLPVYRSNCTNTARTGVSKAEASTRGYSSWMPSMSRRQALHLKHPEAVSPVVGLQYETKLPRWEGNLNLWRARSRLYRSRLKVVAEIYTMHSFALL